LVLDLRSSTSVAIAITPVTAYPLERHPVLAVAIPSCSGS
jgi:hypothetical protein